MADGKRVFVGAVAADSGIPLGTELKLVFPDGSERWVLVCDRGVSGRIIDVWVPSIEDVPERGIDKVQVFAKETLK
jgi:3D (Asp-Asp-Asp) domain-containing protein